MAKRYKILVVYTNGEQEYLNEGDDVAVFSNKRDADEQAYLMQMGLGPEEGVQSINVVIAK